MFREIICTFRCVLWANFIRRIPFFFEPNFDAKVEVLDAARRLQAGQKDNGNRKDYEPVIYREYRMKKVGGNFKLAEGNSKYD